MRRRPANAEATGAEDSPAEETQSRGGRPSGRSSGRPRTRPSDSTSGEAAAPEEPKPKRAPRRRSAAKAAADTAPADRESGRAADDTPPADQESERAAADTTPADRESGRAAADTTPADREAVRTAEPAKPTTRRGSRAKTAAVGGTIEAQIAALSESVADVRRAVETLGEQVDRVARHARLGVFVDVPNLLYGGERVDIPIDVGKLLDYISEGRELVRATAYSPVSDDPSEPTEQQRFVAPFVPYAYRIVTKPLKRFSDGSIKGNFDVEMAIDMVTMSERLDVIAIVSGDADFARVVEMVQSRGVRVEVVAFANSTSAEMRALADAYIELGSIAKQIGA